MMFGNLFGVKPTDANTKKKVKIWKLSIYICTYSCHSYLLSYSGRRLTSWNSWRILRTLWVGLLPRHPLRRRNGRLWRVQSCCTTWRRPHLMLSSRIGKHWLCSTPHVSWSYGGVIEGEGVEGKDVVENCVFYRRRNIVIFWIRDIPHWILSCIGEIR